jgi:hypothetical protein
MKRILFLLVLILVGCSTQKETCKKKTKDCCEKKELK